MGAETRSSQIRVGRVAPTDSQQKQLAEHGQFWISRSTRRRPVRSVEQPRDEVVLDVIIVDGVVVSMVEEVIDLVVVVEKSGFEEVVLVVQLDVDVVDSVSSVTTNTEVTDSSIDPSVHTEQDSFKDLLTGQCLQSMLAMWRYEYVRVRYMPFMFNSNLFIIVP